jgi:hypothetical protein
LDRLRIFNHSIISSMGESFRPKNRRKAELLGKTAAKR